MRIAQEACASGAHGASARHVTPRFGGGRAPKPPWRRCLDEQHRCELARAKRLQRWALHSAALASVPQVRLCATPAETALPPRSPPASWAASRRRCGRGSTPPAAPRSWPRCPPRALPCWLRCASSSRASGCSAQRARRAGCHARDGGGAGACRARVVLRHSAGRAALCCARRRRAVHRGAVRAVRLAWRHRQALQAGLKRFGWRNRRDGERRARAAEQLRWRE